MRHRFNANRTRISLKSLAIPAGFEPATHGVEIRHSADHRLTTETPRTNGDKVRESATNSIVFVEFFGRYLRSGRRGRRFESCHSDQLLLPFTFVIHFSGLFLIAGGFRV